jgi:hypothetical protein
LSSFLLAATLYSSMEILEVLLGMVGKTVMVVGSGEP